MSKYTDGQEKKEARIVPTFTKDERARFKAACERAEVAKTKTGKIQFSRHLHDLGMAWVESVEANQV